MRILITTDTIGGVWNYTVTLVRALVEAGDECLVALIGEPADTQLYSLPGAVDHEVGDYPLEWMRADEERILAAGEWLQALERKWRPDLIHMNQFAYAARQFDAPTVVVAHSDVYSWFREVRDCDAPADEWSRYREWVRAGLKGANAVVAPTGYQSGMLARHYGQPADRVIHNGMAEPPQADRSPASERRMVLTAGRAWDEAKAVRVLDDALDELGERAPSGHLAGSLEGPEGERYLPKRLNTHGRIPREAMDRLYDNSAIYVATSVYEPFGLSPLEGAFHGCALVLSDIGSFRELWQDAGVFVPPVNPRYLGETIVDLLDDPKRLDALAAAARSRARDRYTVARMTDAYRSLYARLVGVTPDDESTIGGGALGGGAGVQR